MAGYEQRKKQLIRPYLKKLIQHITNFEDEDLEYKQCEAFAFSHILHHRYLSVNRTQVQRTISGLIDKFNIHGLDEKAHRLDILVKKFVQSDCFKDHSEADVEWSILQLIACLSDNPTSLVLREDFHPLPSLSDDGRLEDDGVQKLDIATSNNEAIINWGEYLKEGVEAFRLPEDEADSILWSDPEESDDEKISEETTAVSPPQFPLQVAAPGLAGYPSFEKDSRLPAEYSYPNAILKGPDGQEVHIKPYEDHRIPSEVWLKENVQYNWWNDPLLRIEPRSTHPAAKVAILWEELENKQTHGLIPVGGTSLLTEYKVIREVLWILHMPSTTFLFYVSEDGRVTTKPNISIPSLTPLALSSILDSNVCKYSQMVLCLSKFVEDVSYGEREDKKPSLTYQSYAAAIQEELLVFFKKVSTIEDKVTKQDSTNTLVSVFGELSSSFNELEYLYTLHNNSVCNWRNAEGWFAATRLLAHLFDAVFLKWHHRFASIALKLFIKSFCVYIQIIDTWFTYGILQDLREEFIIKCCGEELKTVSYAAALNEINKTEITEMFLVIEKACSDLEHIKRLDEVASLRSKLGNKCNLYEEFLVAIAADLNRYKDGYETSELSAAYVQTCSSTVATGPEGEEEEGHNVLISEAKSELSKNGSRTGSKKSKAVAVPQLKSLISIPAQEVDSMWHDMVTMKILNSPWLLGSFRRCYYPNGKNSYSNRQRPAKADDHYSCLIEEAIADLDIGMLPLYQIIKRNFISLIKEKGHVASKLMMEILMERFKLQHHLSVLGNIFILEASHVVQRFFIALFPSTLPNSTVEGAEYSLNILLDECVESLPATDDLGVQLYAQVTDDVNRPPQNIIGCVDIQYNVEWPLTLVITKDSLMTYNSVFKFFVHIEWALHLLHQLRFSELKETKENIRSVRVLYKLRMFLMHCISTLQYYFRSYTPSDLRAQFDDALKRSSSVTDIVSAHEQYLEKLKTHCLLNKGGNFIMKIIKKLLNMCGDLSQLWQKESRSEGNIEEATELEEQYTYAHVSLSLTLKKIVEQNSNSALKLLSADIESCLPVPASQFTGQGDQNQMACY